MAGFEPFRFADGDELSAKAAGLGAFIPYSESLERWFEPASIDGRAVPNRFTVQPMEGCDGDESGNPGELTFRRYHRYARGGSGLIWFEATAICPEGRSHPNQLALNSRTLPTFQRLVEGIRKCASAAYPSRPLPLLILQLTHAGRYSFVEPLGVMSDVGPKSTEKKIRTVTDADLEKLQQAYISTALLAGSAGFDGVDIKACHGYLLHEILMSNNRTDSRFCGSFENRSRFLLEILSAISRELPGLLLAVRLNLFDGLTAPLGFGTEERPFASEESSDPYRLLKLLVQIRCRLVNVTMGIPRINPYLTRPYNRPVKGATESPEHPLKGVGRLLRAAADLHRTFQDLALVATGFSYLRHFIPQVGAGLLGHIGGIGLIGLGRSSFAYPEGPRDLMEGKKWRKNRSCLACSLCSERLRNGQPTGCSVRDSVYKNWKSR